MSIANGVGVQGNQTNRTMDAWGNWSGGGFNADANKTYGAIAGAYQDNAESALQQMINAAQGAVGSSTNNAQVNGSIDSVKGQADKMNGVAEQIGASAADVNAWAGKVGQTAESLTPYAEAMKSYGEQVFGQGQTLVDQGNTLLGTWANFAPLVGKYTGALSQLDPNNQVSLAAHDVQSSFQNTQGQNARALSRMGVDPSSGAYQAQKAQWDQALAVALSGAKTRARNKGLTEQIAALGQGLGVGSSLATAGAQIGSSGTSAMTQAGGLLGNAANIVQSQGSLYGTAGNLSSAAGGLLGTQANVYQGAGQLQNAAGQLALNLNNQSLDAQKMLQEAYRTATQYYSSQAQGYGSLAGKAGLLNGLFGLKTY